MCLMSCRLQPPEDFHAWFTQVFNLVHRGIKILTIVRANFLVGVSGLISSIHKVGCTQCGSALSACSRQKIFMPLLAQVFNLVRRGKNPLTIVRGKPFGRGEWIDFIDPQSGVYSMFTRLSACFSEDFSCPARSGFQPGSPWHKIP